MATKKKAPKKAAVKKTPFEAELAKTSTPKKYVNPSPQKSDAVEKKMYELNIKPTVESKRYLASLNKIKPQSSSPVEKMPEDLKKSLPGLRPESKRFHGSRFSLYWFPEKMITSRCADKFGYMSSTAVRIASRLPFTTANENLLQQLGDLMGDPTRDTGGDSTIPAGFTYFGQFVDHDITLDVSAMPASITDANTLNNMRTPALDLDSLYGRGPALEPFLYVFPSSGPGTAVKFQMGTNANTGPGGPGGNAGRPGMVIQTNWDVPRTLPPANTAIIGDPRNDENLIIVQFHQTMLQFHNKVVDMLVLAGFTGDIFVEAKKIVTHHYQWAVINDFLKRICGQQMITNAINNVNAPINSPFRMPVEFSVAAYRFGHSMIRNNYWVNFNFPGASMAQVFQFNRNPNLPVFSNWVVDFNAFFNTGVVVPVNNKARKIDSALANELERLPGFTGMMAILATRNLKRALALGLPSGQAMAKSFGVAPMTAAQLTQGLQADEIAALNASSSLLLKKTPLWYYILREAAVLAGGNQLGPVGGKIVADTFIRILKRDPGSYLNVAGGFTPMLPSVTPGDFTVADLVIFAGVTQP
jgi:hypothetical protein